VVATDNEPLSARVKLAGKVTRNFPVAGRLFFSVKAAVTVTEVAPAT
jgi:hypothetical protein